MEKQSLTNKIHDEYLLDPEERAQRETKQEMRPEAETEALQKHDDAWL